MKFIFNSFEYKYNRNYNLYQTKIEPNDKVMNEKYNHSNDCSCFSWSMCQ